MEIATLAAVVLLVGVGLAGRVVGWPMGVGAEPSGVVLPEVMLFDGAQLAPPGPDDGAVSSGVAGEVEERDVEVADAEVPPPPPELEAAWEAAELPELPEKPAARPAAATPARPASRAAASGRESPASAVSDRGASGSPAGGGGGSGEGGRPAARTLRFGVGEGRQPAPAYPAAALRRNQEGTVVVEFLVGPDGRVQSAEAREPSPYPLLNSAAVDTVRRRWRFQPGAVRIFRVPIVFRLE